MSATIAERISLIAQGDADARAWLYDTFAGVLFKKLRFRYGPFALDPEELLQDAYVSFFQRGARALLPFLDRHPPEQQTEDQLRIFLWDLACGIASNGLRARRTRRRHLPEADDDFTAVAAEPDPERGHVVRDLMRRFIDCVSTKGDEVSLYFSLRFVDGMTADEISGVTGWPIEQVYRLRTRLGTAANDCARRLQMDVR